MITAVYPGTFDPLTRGHEDLVRRAAGIFETLIVGVADSRSKGPFFTLDERLAIAREALGHYPNVRIESFTGLLTDFEYEFQMAGMNRSLMRDIEMMFMTPSDQYQFISGAIVREIAQMGGDVSPFVLPAVERWLVEKVARTRQERACN